MRYELSNKKVALWSGVVWLIIFAGIGAWGLWQHNSYRKDLALYQENWAIYQAQLDNLPPSIKEKHLERPFHIRLSEARSRGLTNEEIWEIVQAKSWYKEALSDGKTPEKIKEYIFNSVIKPQEPSPPSYEILIITFIGALSLMVFEYLVLTIIVGYKKVVRKELIILWSVVIYTIVVLFAKMLMFLETGEVSILLLSGWLITGAAYLTYRTRKSNNG